MTDPYDPNRAADPLPPAPPAPWAAPAPSSVPPSDPYSSPPVPSAPPGPWHVPTTPAPSAPPPVVYPPVSGSPATAPFPTTSYQPQAGDVYGYDPVSGQPLSDKSKIIAGLLQLVPGFIFGLGGIGRLYAGHTSLGIAQLVATFVGWASFWCGFVLAFPFFIFIGAWLWFVIDGIVLLAGRPVDGKGRLLRT